MKKIFITFLTVHCACLFAVSAYAEDMYRLIICDKGTSSYSIDNPETFLSQKSIDRRIRQGFAIDETDLPISEEYFDAISATGASIQVFSKWIQTVVVSISDEKTIESLRNLPFVCDLYPVFRGNIPVHYQQETTPLNPSRQSLNNDFYNYGTGLIQISLNNGQLIHEQGFRGKDKTIAVLDGGFLNADDSNFFDQSKILEVKNFTHEKEDPLRSVTDHGTKVLSCMLTNKSGEMIGTAPEAEYYLFKTEVNGSEFPVEEDYWIAALEHADSLGVDIVSSSLGYFLFDDPAMNHAKDELGGRTVLISQAASMAAFKGMVLCNSAGNEANNEWRNIIFPSDAENVLAIGAIFSDSVRTPFSSLGYIKDNQVKPDVMAMGANVSTVGAYGMTSSNGTSFSCPIISGLTASLWQALPQLNSLELIDLIRQTANQNQNPDMEYGYGIADFLKAYNITTTLPSFTEKADIPVMDICDNRIYIRKNNDLLQARLVIYNSLGIKALEINILSDEIDISVLNKGIFIVCLQYGNKQTVKKIIRQ